MASVHRVTLSRREEMVHEFRTTTQFVAWHLSNSKCNECSSRTTVLGQMACAAGSSRAIDVHREDP
jgi:hypothetical protein